MAPRPYLPPPTAAARRVQAARLARAQSIVAAARSAGVSPRTWVRWERGECEPDLVYVAAYERSVRPRKRRRP